MNVGILEKRYSERISNPMEARGKKQLQTQHYKRQKPFENLEEIEVLCLEEDYYGVWYRAKFIDDVLEYGFIVQYVDLLDERYKQLQEVRDPKMVRPKPPKLDLRRDFFVGEAVEVWDKDGWWMGRVAAFNDKTKVYTIVFDLIGKFEDHMAINMRPAQILKNGRWIHPQNSLKTIQKLVNDFLNNDDSTLVSRRRKSPKRSPLAEQYKNTKSREPKKPRIHRRGYEEFEASKVEAQQVSVNEVSSSKVEEPRRTLGIKIPKKVSGSSETHVGGSSEADELHRKPKLIRLKIPKKISLGVSSQTNAHSTELIPKSPDKRS